MTCTITAIAQDKTVHCIANRPAWIKVYGYYKNLADTMSTEQVFLSIFDNPDPKIFSNSCATRVSLTLLNAGLKSVGSGFPARKGPFTGKSITTSAQALITWLKKNWGEPEVKTKVVAIDGAVNKAEYNKQIQEVRKLIGNKTGVYGLWSDNSKWASGHITLWNQVDVVHGMVYTNDAYIGAVPGTIYFWELK